MSDTQNITDLPTENLIKKNKKFIITAVAAFTAGVVVTILVPQVRSSVANAAATVVENA